MAISTNDKCTELCGLRERYGCLKSGTLWHTVSVMGPCAVSGYYSSLLV